MSIHSQTARTWSTENRLFSVAMVEKKTVTTGEQWITAKELALRAAIDEVPVRRVSAGRHGYRSRPARGEGDEWEVDGGERRTDSD